MQPIVVYDKNIHPVCGDSLAGYENNSIRNDQNREINMALTAQEIFVETVRFLSPEEQFHLSVLILQELHVVNQSDTWNEQDKKDLTAASLQYATALYLEENDLV